MADTTHSKAARQPLFKLIPFDRFESEVENSLPPAFDYSVSQVQNIKEFLTNGPRKCISIVVEDRYIDRAFIDEYKEFYSTSFESYDNYCKRLHFFSTDKVDEKVAQVIESIEVAQGDPIIYAALCKNFSDEHYLGFMVVKPLPATRIGRTVLRHPLETENEREKVVFPCTRIYTAQLWGLELTVCGLPFQEQDGGMSACASTATWASLSHISEFESFQVPSPATITKFASSQMTNAGRSIPQESGLTVGQMCRAIEVSGLSPQLIPLDGLKPRTKKALLSAAIKSGFAPILIIRNDDDDANHAVSVGGMVVQNGEYSERVQLTDICLLQESDCLSAIYINDDRNGPYQLGNLDERCDLEISNENRKWSISHLLIPLHPKIRLGFLGLYEVGVEVADVIGRLSVGKISEVSIEFWIKPSIAYRKHALFGKNRLSPQAREFLCHYVTFPRYVGIVRFKNASFGIIDVLLDVTNTIRHTNVLLVLGRSSVGSTDKQLIEKLASNLHSPFTISK